MEKVNEMDVMLRIVSESDDEIIQKENRESWEKVYGARQNKSIMKSKIAGIENVNGKPCGIIWVGHVKGLMPLEFSGFDHRRLVDLVGHDVVYKVINLDRQNEMFVASRVEAIEHLQGITWDKLRKGQKVIGRVTDLFKRHLILDIGGIEVELFTENLSYEWIDDLADIYKMGDDIMVKVVNVDKKQKVLEISHKALLPNPWPDCVRRYQEGNQYIGKVSGTMEYGVFVSFGNGVDSLSPHPSHDVGHVKKGDEVLVRIVETDMKEQKIRGRIMKKI